MSFSTQPFVVLQVALALPMRQCFDYLAPYSVHADSSWVGCRVLVPFGKNKLVGLIVSTSSLNQERDKLKRILEKLDQTPLLQGELLQSLEWAAKYYLSPIGEVFEAALPARLRAARDIPRPPIMAYRAKTSIDAPLRGARANALMQELSNGARTASELLARFPSARPVLKKLIEEGYVEALTRLPMRSSKPVVSPPPHHAAQIQAITGISEKLDHFAVHVLDGVTGSGKTEVYIELASKVIEAGKQVLILVPEIGLTPQTINRFRERLPGSVVAFHSGLADGERAESWLSMQRGDSEVAIGTRSNVFTPMIKPGLIVIDEEHDASFKQQDGFRYNARDLAIKRAQSLNIPIVLGSATPALETLAHIANGRYTRWRLPARAGFAKPPSVSLIDLRQKRIDNGLSKELIDAIGGTLARGEQALIFRNRRGFAPILQCHECGWHAECRACDRPLTLHRGENQLRCHHCGRVEYPPRDCPHCNAPGLSATGVGTERLEQALQEQFPKYRVVRIDRDTTRTRDALENQLASLHNDEPAILIGTQMLAKGHDLKNLTLCGIVDVDSGLYSSDFRSEERLAQLIVQVSGRVGRAHKAGQVLLQTHHPEHPLLELLLHQGYEGFAEQHLAARKESAFPPYSHLALLRAEAQHSEIIADFFSAVMQARENLEKELSDLSKNRSNTPVHFFGPMPAPMPRRAGFMRAQILIQSESRAALHAHLQPLVLLVEKLKQARKVRWSLDIDPYDLS